MEKRILLSLVYLPFLSNAQEAKQGGIDTMLIEKAEQLYYADQKWRHTLSSLVSSNYETRTHYNMSPGTKKGCIADAVIWKEISAPSDEKNTQELIALTYGYGLPRMDRLGNKHTVYLVLVHSDKAYFPEIINLVQREHILGNIAEWEKDHILCHVQRNREGHWLQAYRPIWFGTDEYIMNYFLK